MCFSLIEYDFCRELQFPHQFSKFEDKAPVSHNFLLLFLCLQCFCVYALVCVWGGAWTHVCACMWKLNTDVKCLPWLLFISCFMTGSPTEPRIYCLARLAGQWILRYCGSYPSLCTRVTDRHEHDILFHICARDPTNTCSHVCEAGTFLSCLFNSHWDFYCRHDA